MTFVILYIRNDNSIRFQPIVIITIYQYQSNETKILNKIKKSKNPKTEERFEKKGSFRVHHLIFTFIRRLSAYTHVK